MLRCFVALLTATGSAIWSGELASYAEVVFDSIKDNPAHPLLLVVQSSSTALWRLDWLKYYLESIWDSPIFPNVMPKVFIYLGEELQHMATDPSVRVQALKVLFQVCGWLILNVALLLCSLINEYMGQITRFLEQKASKLSNSSIQAATLRNVCGTHAEIIIRVAFLRDAEGNWAEARSLARELLEGIFSDDAAALLRHLRRLGPFRDEQMAIYRPSVPSWYSKHIPAGKTPEQNARTVLPSSPLKIHAQIWKQAYKGMAKGDADATAMAIRAISTTAHLQPLADGSGASFSSGFLRSHPDERMRVKFEDSVASYNAALSVMREGVLAQVEGFAESSNRSTLKAFLMERGVTEGVIGMMLSADADLVDAAKALALNAYDTFERSACYLALLEHHSLGSFEGTVTYLKAFDEYSVIVPEACDVAKSLVRSLKEILDGLCDPSGLLSRADRSPEVDVLVWIPRLWKAMSVSLSVILQRCKLWAVYFTNEDMVIWMRDALIFGRDMVSYVHALQRAVEERRKARNADPKGKGIKIKKVELIAELGTVLSYLVEWLKLTDPETLHQAHELLKALLACYEYSTADPPKETIELLEKYVERKKGTRTELSDSKLSELLVAFQPFLDDVRVIEELPSRSKSTVTATSTKPSTSSSRAASSTSTPKSSESSQKGVNLAALERAKQLLAMKGASKGVGGAQTKVSSLLRCVKLPNMNLQTCVTLS